MPLSIDSLEFADFRNYEHLILRDLPRVTVLYGPNAVGKTNIIEGIQLLTALQSFRHQRIEHMIRNGCENARLQAHMVSDSRNLSLSATFEQGKRTYHLNGKAKKPADLQGMLPAVVFTPDDLDLAKGAHGVRRTMLDEIGAQVSKNYHAVNKEYENAIKQKNRLLKEEGGGAFLDSINEVVLACGTQFFLYRQQLFNRILPLIQSSYSAIAGEGETLVGSYVPSWLAPRLSAPRYDDHDDEDSPSDAAGRKTGASHLTREQVTAAFAASLHERREEEIARKHAVVGPQGDHIDFYLNGGLSTMFASQGQQRSIVLAIKLAQVALINEMLGTSPILLLDDVMSELDQMRREALSACMDESTQVFITTTNIQYFDEDFLQNVKVVQLPLA